VTHPEDTRRARFVLALALASVALVVPAASAPRVELRATLSCLTEPGSGRLVCTVDVQSPPGHRISWCDALVVSAPPALTPLRSRVRGTSAPPRVVLGFVRGSGAGGRIELLARAVACPNDAGAACVSLSTTLGVDVEAR
jgi:hypothetical protein